VTRIHGFTVVELLLAMAMTLAIMAAGLALAQPAQAALGVQLESIDVTQRLRAAVDSLTRDILMAGSGLPPGVPAVNAYQPGSSESGLTVRYVPAGGGVMITRSYYVRIDSGTNLSELRRSDGSTDVPVVDHIASAVFTCFDESAVGVPSCGEAERIRRVRIALRVEGVMRHTRRSDTMLRVPAVDVVVDIAPRALPGGW
jgi:hypothetical protein